MYERELYHYGVRGMKWGVRKDRSSGGKGGVLKTAFKVTHPLTYMAGKKAKSTASKVANSKRARSAVNKYRNLTGSKQSAAMKKYRNKNIDGMSDNDLRKAVNRMNLERQYRDLTKADYMRGQRYTADILKYQNTGERAVRTLRKVVK